MGKHSSPKPSFAKQLIRDLAPGRRSAGRRAANAPSSATSVLATVKQRPVVAAIAVPAAATAAVVGSTVVMGPPESGNVTTEAASTTPEESTAASTPSQKELDAERKKAGEEYLEKVKDDPKYKNKTSKTDLEVKAPPKPKPTAESSASSEKSDDSSSDEKSSDEKSSGEGEGTSSDTSAPPCSVSSSIESGLLPNAVNGYRAVCAKFPEVKTFGGRRPGTGSDHNTGEAVDIMITGSTGDRIAEYLIQNQSALNVKYVIWKQRIWMPGQGWKGMEDRGDATANHFDHVHASFN
ncbi:ligand-binding protein SH3 [Brevibacterium sp. JSBI002]|uniref:ligand-binding protein SH3 n=1 Tax=Brevibacterium sp. JSBI002 TaxID=2886045 RepID=UPI0022326C73|nr:ligand-binding protein SH3 [Brevibacterium sp. JSBI002]UZD61222.1 ligand-binding protein SH3 [Brevibacterium sp. JSBI002]